VEKVYLVGDIRLPGPVRNALDLKNSAFQKTLQREQEVAQADSNRILSESITPELVRYRSIDKWNGELPRFHGGGGPVPFIDVGAAR